MVQMILFGVCCMYNMMKFDHVPIKNSKKETVFSCFWLTFKKFLNFLLILYGVI